MFLTFIQNKGLKNITADRVTLYNNSFSHFSNIYFNLKSIFLSIYRSIYLSIYIYISIFRSIYLSFFYLSIYLSRPGICTVMRRIWWYPFPGQLICHVFQVYPCTIYYVFIYSTFYLYVSKIAFIHLGFYPSFIYISFIY